MSSTPLIDALHQYVGLNRRRFHVPGHAGGVLGLPLTSAAVAQEWHAFDLTELDGLDALAHPEGVIAESQQRAATLFGAKQTFYCVNGASIGLHGAMLVAFRPGDAVLVPRNVHRAVVAGLVLGGFHPVWIQPQWEPAWGVWGEVTLGSLQAAYQQNPAIRGLVLTHPTYEGLPSDIADIAKFCRHAGLRLVVDEAHGGLWPLSARGFPPSAIQAEGVDAVIHSLHKTGGSLTQTALLHLPVGSQLNAAHVQESLNHLHTTSPSYLLMASIEGTCAWLGSAQGRDTLQGTLHEALATKARINQLPRWTIATDNDPMRYLIRHATMLPDTWAAELEVQQGLSYETLGAHSTLYLRQLGLSAEDDAALLKGLSDWDDLPTKVHGESSDPWPPIARPEFALPKQAMSPRDAFFALGKQVPVDQASGRVSRQTVVRCPPGIPVLVAGERIEPHHLPHLPSWVDVVA